MKCSQLLLGAVSLGVVVLVYLTTSAQCKIKITKASYDRTTKAYIKLGWGFKLKKYLRNGRRKFGDQLLINETIKEERCNKMIRVSTDMRFETDNGESYCTITFLEVIDKGKGGYVVLISGGSGYHYADLYFESQEGEGFEFNVLIFGHKH